MVYFHGGGYIICCIESHETACQQLAHHSGTTVISVEYRLAPEHPFPTPLNDGINSYLKIRQLAEELKIDPSRMMVGGDSAGANLSAVLCQQLRGTPDAPIRQFLVYPPVGGARSRPSYKLFAEGCLLTTEWVRHSMSLYLPDKALVNDPRVSPMRAESLDGLPPATIIVAGFDPLRDDGFAYAEGLRKAGVPVRFHFHPELFHGYFNFGHILPEAYKAVKKDAVQLGRDLKAHSRR
jgi:acetyl esterase